MEVGAALRVVSDPPARASEMPRRVAGGHLAELELLRSLLRTAVDLESRCDFGESPTGPRSNHAMFLVHFAELRRDIELWDVAVARVRRAGAALWNSLEGMLVERGVHEPDFSVGSVVDRVALLIVRDARGGSLGTPHRLTFERFLGRRSGDPVTLYMDGQLVARVASGCGDHPFEGAAAAEALLQQIFEELAGGPEAAEVVHARDHLLSMQESLLERLSIAVTPLVTMGCPVCAGSLGHSLDV